MNNIQKLAIEPYMQDLFNHMAENHGLTLLQSEMQAIVDICAKAYAQQQSEPVARIIADPMLLPAFKAPLIDWKVDLMTLELDTDLFTAPPNTVPVDSQQYKRAVWESLEIAMQHAKLANNPFKFLCNQIEGMHNTEFSVRNKTVPLEKYNKLVEWVKQLGHEVERRGINLTIEGKDFRQAIAEAEGK